MLKTQWMFLVFTAALVNGCYYPMHSGAPGGSSGINGTTAVAGVAGAAGGAALGNAVNKSYGAPVGAVVGAGLAGGTTYVFQQRHQREVSEAYDQGKRDGRAEVFDEWWSENAVLNDPAESPAKKVKTRQIPLPAGDYESVPYHSRAYEYVVRP